MMYNTMNDRRPRHPHGNRAMERFDDMPEAMPRDFGGFEEGQRCMLGRPGGHGGPFGSRSHSMSDGHGMPPRRPDPQFLKRRIDDGDLMELIDMAGRMSQRRPQGGPARSQALVLSILAGRDALSQRELQQMMGIQPGSLSELVSKLEGKGYLIREKAEDRRGNLLRITDEGRKAIPTADSQPRDDSFAALTDEQQDHLAALLRTLLGSWVDAMEAARPPERRAIPHREKPVEI